MRGANLKNLYVIEGIEYTYEELTPFYCDSNGSILKDNVRNEDYYTYSGRGLENDFLFEIKLL